MSVIQLCHLSCRRKNATVHLCRSDWCAAFRRYPFVFANATSSITQLHSDTARATQKRHPGGARQIGQEPQGHNDRLTGHNSTLCGHMLCPILQGRFSNGGGGYVAFRPAFYDCPRFFNQLNINLRHNLRH